MEGLRGRDYDLSARVKVTFVIQINYLKSEILLNYGKKILALLKLYSFVSVYAVYSKEIAFIQLSYVTNNRQQTLFMGISLNVLSSRRADYGVAPAISCRVGGFIGRVC